MAEIYNRVIDEPGENTSDAIILSRIKRGAKVLECGCATGYMTKYMRDKLDAQVWIIEFNEEAFELAKAYAEGGICANLEQIDAWLPQFEGMQFDYILFADVLEHLRNPGEVLRRAASLLCEDGEVIVSLPNVAHADVLMNLYRNQWNYKQLGLLDNTHIHFWAPENIRELFALADLAPVLLDCSIIPPFQTEQLCRDMQPSERADFYAICKRPRSDIYQFVVAAKHAEYVLQHGIACEDLYQQRHDAYCVPPLLCTVFEEELRKQEAEHVEERNGHLQLLNAHEQLSNRYALLEQHHNDLQKLQADLDKQIADLLARNNALLAEQTQLKSELQQAQHAYDAISNAFFWKITKPARVVLDKLKFIFRNNRTAHLIWGGLKSLNRNGLSATWKKTRAHLRGESTAAQPNAVFYRPGDPVTILCTPHTKFVADLVANSLHRLGVAVTILTEEPEVYSEEMHIVICPQMFKHYPGRYIAFQMEQTISSRWLTEAYFDALHHSYAVLDYSLVNVDYFKKHTGFGKMFYYAPIDYLPGMRRPVGEYEYDVVFYGDPHNPRRKAMLDALSERFNVHVISNLFGEALYRELNKAKIVINIHYYENAMLETTRLYEALSLGTSVIVSERSSDPKEEERLEGIVDFVDVNDIDAMADRIAYWLAHDEERMQLLEANNRILSERVSAFDFFFYRFLLANDWLSFDRFYELAGDFIHFAGDRVCLSLPEDADRRAAFDQDNHYGFEVFPGLRHKRGWTGCGMSYKFIIKKAHEQALERILVCEDDVFFPEDFRERFENCLRYLDENRDWNVFQGLMADLGNVHVKQVERANDQVFVEMDHLISMVFNLYDKSTYPHIIAWDETNTNVHKNTIDRALESKELRIVTTAPFLVGHKEDLTSTIWDFSNTQYNDLIAASSKKLAHLVEQFEASAKN